MYSCNVNEIVNWHYSDYKDVLVRVHRISADTKEKLFKRVYSFERSSRYDSARRYEIDDAILFDEYKKWKVNGVTMELFYGSGTVD